MRNNKVYVHNAAMPDEQQMSRLEELVLNARTLGREWLTNLFDPRRSLDDECGYPKSISPAAYQELYEREPIAARVVEVMAKESWQVQPSVYEDDDPGVTTEFEQAWLDLNKRLRGEFSWYADEESSPIWEYLERADKTSGIGHYSIVILGFDDGLPLSEPVQGIQEEFSAPREAGAASTFTGIWNLTVNAGETKGRKLRYVRVYPEPLAPVVQWESNRSSPRYGQPVMYSVTHNDVSEGQGGIGMTVSTEQVHWTRVIHVADNLTSSECWGRPRMKQVYNRLMDLRKVYGADAEAFWKNVIMRIFFETHPELGGDVPVDVPALRDMMEQMENGFQRWAQLSGMSAKTVSPSVVDPVSHINVQIEAICILLGIPIRIFKGSERGELASAQDDAAWNDRLKQRQRGYITPRVIVPLVDRLIMVGCLPKPKKGYKVWWPDLTSQTDADKSLVAIQKVQALAAYVSGGLESIMTPMDFLTKFLYMTDDEAEAILQAAEKEQKKLEAELAEQEAAEAALLAEQQAAAVDEMGVEDEALLEDVEA